MQQKQLFGITVKLAHVLLDLILEARLATLMPPDEMGGGRGAEPNNVQHIKLKKYNQTDVIKCIVTAETSIHKLLALSRFNEERCAW